MSLEAISPLDGRYSPKTKELSEYFSEYALIRHRLYVEIEYLKFLSKEKFVRVFTSAERKILLDLVKNFDVKEAGKVKTIEATTNHDVKAVEYYIKQKLEKTSLKDVLEFVHFALTSEDVNNLSYSLMLSQGIKHVVLPELRIVMDKIAELTKTHAKTPMLSRTHGQSASPTTLGKECGVFLMRLSRQYKTLSALKFPGKLNGAVGNFNAHSVAYPKIDWLRFSKAYVSHIGLEPNAYTTQIEPHDGLSEGFMTLERINTILIDLSRDFWSYISLGYLVQQTKKGEVGSSTMPHKVNPIDFENAEGNFGIANALLAYLSSKLPISRMQRDLTDSTTIRNNGVAVGYSLLGYKSLAKGLSKIEVSVEALKADLSCHPVLAEAVQTILRREKAEMPYEKLKTLTRGKEMSMNDMKKFIAGLDVSSSVRKELEALSPENYIGLAPKIALQAVAEYKKLR